MDRDKLDERRQDWRISPKRVRLADSLSANYLKLGAGVSLSMMSWGLLGGFTVAAEGLGHDSVTPRRPTSEIRLKSIGSTIELTPIGQHSSPVPTALAAQPHATKIQLNPMTGDSLETLDPPIFAGAHTETIRSAAVHALASGPVDVNHPQILSIRRLDLRPANKTSVHAAAEAESNLANTANRHAETSLVTNLDDVAILPLLPLPTNQQWVAAASTASEAGQRLQRRPDQRSSNSPGTRASTAKIPMPQTISVAQVKRLSTTHRGLSVRRESMAVPARLSGFAKPAHVTEQPPTKVPGLTDDVARIMDEIGDQYPGAQIVFANADGRLVVRGNCDDRNQATAIVRLIRSHLLIPVDDQMVIR